MIIQMILLLLMVWYVFIKGLYYVIASKDRINFGQHTRFEDLALTEKEYTYRNQTAGKLYLCCGGVIGAFLTFVCIMYNFFPNSAHFIVGLLFLMNILFEDGILKTIIDFRFNEEEKQKTKEENN